MKSFFTTITQVTARRDEGKWPPLPIKDGAFMLGFALLTVVFLIFTFYPPLFDPLTGDVKNFHTYILAIGEEKVPYRDFVVEYPPFSLLFIILPALASNLVSPSLTNYSIAFQMQSFILAAALMPVVRNLLLSFYPTPSNYKWRMAFFGVMLPIISLYIFRRFDIAPALLVALAFYLLYQQRPGWAGICLGLATTTKLYPFLVLPFLFLYFVRNRGEWKLFLRLGISYLIAIIVSVLPFALFSFSGLVESLKYQTERGLQIESFFASIIWIGNQFGLVEVFRTVDHKSTGYFSSWNAWLLPTSTILLVSGLLGLFVYSWWVSNPRRFTLTRQWLLLATFLAISWFIIANKVISPQYMVWLLPFLPFLRHWMAWLGGLIIALGTLDYLFLDAGVSDSDWPPMLIVLIRNVLLLLLIIVVFRDFQQESKIQPNLDNYLK